MPSYQKGPKKDRVTAGVVFLNGRPIIENTGDVADDLGEGVPEDVYWGFFKKNFKKLVEFKTTIKDVIFLEKIDKFNFKESVFDYHEGEKFKIAIPRSQYKADHVDKFDFLIIFDNMSVNRQVSNVYSQYGISRSNKLRIYGKFLIWDVSKGTTVSYGKAEVLAPVIFGMTKNTWKDGLSSFIIKMFKNSPFYPPSSGNFKVMYEEL